MSENLIPFSCSSGPQDARVMFVLEAWGEREAVLQRPLCGASGQEFIRLIQDSGLCRDDNTAKTLIDALWPDSKTKPETFLSLREYWLKKHSFILTNVFNLRPGPNSNEIDLLCAKKAEVSEALPGYNFPQVKQGKYIHPRYLPHLARLKAEIEEVKPNLIIACGNISTWALLNSAGISKIRGAVAESSLVPGTKVLPTYHPAALFRKYDWRPIVLADLLKAKFEMGFPEIRRRSRKILVDPTLPELWKLYNHCRANPEIILSVDIETTAKQITCIGFGTSADLAVVCPFWKEHWSDPHYWSTASEEVQAWTWVRAMLELPNPKLFQNGLYDLQYLRRMGFKILNCEHDTMLLHHSLFPELPKGLDFLGSIYCNEASWKLMRKVETFKRDE